MLAKKMFFLNLRKFMLAKKNQKTFFSRFKVFSGIVFFKTKTSLEWFGFLGHDKTGQIIVLIPNCVVRFLGGFFDLENSFCIKISYLFLLDSKKKHCFH